MSTPQVTNVLVLLPAKARQAIYLAYGVVSILASVASAVYAGMPQYTVPEWLTAVLIALGVLATPIGMLAASNVKPSNPDVAPHRISS